MGLRGRLVGDCRRGVTQGVLRSERISCTSFLTVVRLAEGKNGHEDTMGKGGGLGKKSLPRAFYIDNRKIMMKLD